MSSVQDCVPLSVDTESRVGFKWRNGLFGSFLCWIMCLIKVLRLQLRLMPFGALLLLVGLFSLFCSPISRFLYGPGPGPLLFEPWAAWHFQDRRFQCIIKPFPFKVNSSAWFLDSPFNLLFKKHSTPSHPLHLYDGNGLCSFKTKKLYKQIAKAAEKIYIFLEQVLIFYA